MNPLHTRQDSAAQASEKPERDRQFDAAVLATMTILLAIAFWMHLKDDPVDPQASSHAVHEQVQIVESGSVVAETVSASRGSHP